jgi:hypothetical protein
MSGSSVAYHLRVNKYVDRRLFIEALELVSRFQTLADHGYISMGGGYLEDFRVIHQAFGIRRMLSFDFDQWIVERQKINKPYGFIRCEQSGSTEVVERFQEERDKLVGAEGNVIVWLDYTQPSQRYQQLIDLKTLIAKMIPGDIFRITLNAHRNTFGSNDQFIIAKRANKTKHATLAEWWHEKLVHQLKDLFPPERDNPEFMEKDAPFAATLARAIRRAAIRGLPTHQQFIVEPLISVAYADIQQMITVTGIVLKSDQQDVFRNRVRWDRWPHKPGDDWDQCVHLAVPHLSAKERHIIHDKMYYQYWPNLASILDFRLDASEDRHAEMVDQYMTHYLRYPIFAPIDSV